MSPENRAKINDPYGQGNAVVPNSQHKIVNSRASLRSRLGGVSSDTQLRICGTDLKQIIAANRSGAVSRHAASHRDGCAWMVSPRFRYNLKALRARRKYPRGFSRRGKYSTRGVIR